MHVNYYIKKKQGIYPVYSSKTINNGIITKIDSYQFNGEYLTWTIAGNSAGTIFYRNEKFNATEICGIVKIENKEIKAKYVYYYLTTILKKNVNPGSGIPILAGKTIKKIKIPIPPIEIQTKIIEILDHFDKLCNDISDGIPAEIKIRQEQYEYYRNKLLTFS